MQEDSKQPKAGKPAKNHLPFFCGTGVPLIIVENSIHFLYFLSVFRKLGTIEMTNQ